MGPPKKTTIRGQRHSLAYITAGEAKLLRSSGGGVTPTGGQYRGPDGIPSFFSGAPGPGPSGDGSGSPGGVGGGSGGGVPSTPSSTTSSTTSSTPTGPTFDGYRRNIDRQGAQVRRDDDIYPVAKGDTSGTGLSSDSTAQPISTEAAAVKRREALDNNRGLSGIEERDPIGLSG